MLEQISRVLSESRPEQADELKDETERLVVGVSQLAKDLLVLGETRDTGYWAGLAGLRGRIPGFARIGRSKDWRGKDRASPWVSLGNRATLRARSAGEELVPRYQWNQRMPDN